MTNMNNGSRKLLRRILVVAAILAIVGSSGFGAINYMGRTALLRQNKTQADELARAQKEAREFKGKYTVAQSSLDQARSQIDLLSPDNARMKDTIGAFALQAASCDALKRTLKATDPGV